MNSPERCKAKTRAGTPCRRFPVKGKRRCRLHGGCSTGPRTAEGRARCAEARFKHGRYSGAAMRLRKLLSELSKQLVARDHEAVVETLTQIENMA